MTILFDATDAYVRSVLRRAQNRGQITLAELERIIKAGKGGQITPNEADIADTIDALANMDIEIELVSSIRRRARMLRLRGVEITEILPNIGAAHCSPAWRLKSAIAPGSLAVNLDGLVAAWKSRQPGRSRR